MIRNSAIIIWIVFVFCGCSTNYIRPPSDQTAFLEIAQPIELFQYFESGNCGFDKSFPAEFDPLQREDRTLFALSGKRIGLNLLGFNGLSTCSVNLSFQLESNRRYRAKFSMDDKKCYGEIVRIENNLEVEAPEIALIQMGWDPSLANTCSPLE